MIKTATIDEQGSATSFADTQSARRIRDFLAFAKSRDSAREYFVLFLKPGAVKDFDEIAQGLERMGFDMGFDLIGADQTVVPTKEVQ